MKLYDTIFKILVVGAALMLLLGLVLALVLLVLAITGNFNFV